MITIMEERSWLCRGSIRTAIVLLALIAGAGLSCGGGGAGPSLARDARTESETLADVVAGRTPDSRPWQVADVVLDLAVHESDVVDPELPGEVVYDVVADIPDITPETVADTSADISSIPLCLVGPQNAACLHETTTLLTGVSGLAPRDVHWQVPAGSPPAQGWPAVVLFQGSFLPAGFFWSSFLDAPFGMWNQVLLVKSLLESGFAVVTPEAHLEGGTYWDTNIPPYTIIWETAPDHFFVLDILAALAGGEFGPVDMGRLYAGGISSGGYMTSRMAVSYPGVFKALAIQSASYATCAGMTCFVPSLPADHPPTLFLHGELDATVPIFTVQSYASKLAEQGTELLQETDANAGHEWLKTAPDVVTNWFLTH